MYTFNTVQEKLLRMLTATRKAGRKCTCLTTQPTARCRSTTTDDVHEKGSQKRSSRDIDSIWGAKAATICTARHQLLDSYFNYWLWQLTLLPVYSGGTLG